MAENNNPSLGLNPADARSLSGTLRKVLQKAMQSTDDMLPATVIAASADRKYVTVRPQIMVVGTSGEKVSRAKIAKVPMFHIGAGGFVLTFPVKPGDAGWIKATDRDLSLYLQANKESTPNTSRLHSFEDGVFIPDAARLFTLAEGETDSAVLQNLAGTVYIALGADYIKIKAPTKVRIETPLVEMTGDLTVEGTIRGQTDVLAGDDEISGVHHTHGGVTTGAGHTGEPDA